MSAPRILLTAPRSGAGKTTVVCGLLQAMADRGLRPAAFKCGPDYIDPMFHSRVLGVEGCNLDLFFTGPERVRWLLASRSEGCGIAVLEGVMGYYDGMGVTTGRASAFDLAVRTETPAVLIVDARGAALSVCAEILGFLRFRPDSRIRAVLLNRCSAAQYRALAPVIRETCGVETLGYLPFDKAFALESRHLGLVTAQEVEGLQEKLEAVAEAMRQSVDLDGLVRLAAQAPDLSAPEPPLPRPVSGGPTVAVAMDRAFCFYYRENLELLERLGARLRFFSPLEDSSLPQGTDALYLGGGYPELHARKLSENGGMRAAVRAAVESGMPTVAECGGFLYLHRTLTDPDGREWPMADVIGAGCRYTGRLRRFGYVELTAAQDSLLCSAGETLRAHEFHYYESDECGADFHAVKPAGTAAWECGHALPRLYAGFPHLYFYAAPAAARRFVAAAAEFRKERTTAHEGSITAGAPRRD